LGAGQERQYAQSLDTTFPEEMDSREDVKVVVSDAGHYSRLNVAGWLGLGTQGYRVLMGHVVEMGELLRAWLEQSLGLALPNAGNHGPVTLFRAYPQGVDKDEMLRRELNDPGFRAQVEENNAFNRRHFGYECWPSCCSASFGVNTATRAPPRQSLSRDTMASTPARLAQAICRLSSKSLPGSVWANSSAPRSTEQISNASRQVLTASCAVSRPANRRAT
jgi:hypothetical protein